MGTPAKIIVGISGGVDSAVAALCLLRAGHEVEGLHMTNWDEGDAYCTAAADYQEARRVCADLDIPLHRANFSREYRDGVFADFLRGHRAGRTPNPDVLCNRVIKFGSFVTHAKRLGAGLIATGHYARLGAAAQPRLLKGSDAGKDQSYFLHAVEPEALRYTRFPIGHLTKPEVRRMALEAGLINHARRDSTGICFIGERPFREFLQGHLSGERGPMQTPDGAVVGEHEGLMFYTIGQRSGLRIGGKGGGGSAPWYVARKDPQRNALIVTQGRDHPLLWSNGLRTESLRWISGEPVELRRSGQMSCTAKIRHRQPDAACRVHRQADGGYQVEFERPQWAPAPGQYVVLYSGDECLGGGVIEATGADSGAMTELRTALTA